MSKKRYTAHPPKKRKRRHQKKKNIKAVILIIVILACALIIGGMWMLSSKYGVNIKTIMEYKQEAIELVENSTAETFRPNQATIIYSENGTEIHKLYENEDSTYLSFDEIPKSVINAFVSVEDRTFWENSGIDTKGIVRVIYTYVKSGGDTAHGASTITQQVARDIFLTNEKSLERKVKEIFIAQEMTKKYDKELILEFYCNNCCFANAVYGIEDASQTYLGKSASELTLSEAAYLCAIPNRPEYYDPFDDPTTALTRRDKILDDMYECGYITEAEMNEAMNQEITVVAKEDSQSEFHNYASSLAIKYASEYLMEYKYDFTFQYEFSTEEEYNTYHEEYSNTYAAARRNLEIGGYQIYTSIDLDAMNELQTILDEGLAWNTATDANNIYNLQGAITVIDNETGKIVAAVGGRSQDEISNMVSLNRAIQSPRQPGSTIKPLVVYGPALEQGYTANSILTNVNETKAKGKTAEDIKKMEGEEMTLRYALEHSKNGAVYWLASNIGMSYGMNFLENLNFSYLHPNDYTMSTALGGMYYGATTTEMANAYSTIANHGTYTKADCLISILNSDGKEIYEAPDSKSIYSQASADQLADILKGVLTRGTASSLKWSSSTKTEAFGKTGTTNDNRDGWFCGVTPYYSIAVWVGSDDYSSVSGLAGGTHPAKIWKSAMLSMIDGLPTASFDLDVPDELSYKNSTSAKLPTEQEDEELEEEALEDGETADANTENGNDTSETADPSDNSQGNATTPSTPSATDTPATDITGSIIENDQGTDIDGMISNGSTNSNDSQTDNSNQGTNKPSDENNSSDENEEASQPTESDETVQEPAA